MKMEEGNLITDPDFQRNLVWKKLQKSRFIESILLNIPLPPLYLNQTMDGKYIIVDGLQRSTTLKEFLGANNKNEVGFVLQDLRAVSQLNGKRCKDLSPNLQTRILDKRINCFVIRPSVPIKIVYDIFNRINTGGTALNRQEVRNCIFMGPSTVLLSYLSELDCFMKAIDFGISNQRMKDKEVILRYLAFQIFDYKEYNGDIDDFLGETMKYLNNLGLKNIIDFHNKDLYLRKDDDNFKNQIIEKLKNIPEIREIITNFEKVMRLTFEFFKERNFRFPLENSRGRINIAILESVGYFFSKYDEEYLINNKEKIQKNFNYLLENEDYENAVRFSTNDRKRVIMRFEKALDILGDN